MDTDSTKTSISKEWLKLRSGTEIRGPMQLFNDTRVERLGYAFACWLAERMGKTPDALRLAVGRDARDSSERILAALIRGITAADSDVMDCGLCAAPALFMTMHNGEAPADGAVMVTTSAPAPELNGFKFMTATGGLKPDDTAHILKTSLSMEVPERLVMRVDATERYQTALRQTVANWLEDDALRPLLGMRVVVDARGSVGADYALFLKALGVDIEGSLYARQGEAPAIPDLESGELLEALSEAVRANRADLGVSFSADGDRAALVDEDGQPIAQNRLIALVAAILLDKRPGATLVTDSVTSAGLSAFIAEWGGVHYRFKRGYRNVIDEAVRLNAEGIDCPLAIETSGHAAFRDNGFMDDGVYLATRIICEALNRKREGQRLLSLTDDLRQSVESLELRLPILDFEDWEPEEEAQEIVEILLSHTLTDPEWQLAPDNREGVRITFNLDGGVNNALFQLRMSVHDPVMALYAESDVPGGIKRILRELYDLIKDTKYLNLAPLKRAIDL